MKFHALKVGGSQNPGMETENQVKKLLGSTTLLTMDILQLTENVLLRSRAWTWPHCHHVNVPGMMDQGPLTPGKWMLQVDLQRRGEKVDKSLMETIMMDSTGMKALVEALQEAATLPEEEGAEVIGEEEIT
uniref:Uncharacterized protein n=1 Tax=Pavo cristatus TaxID=9049 RepID=A0A8C9L496_PAVCR